MLLKEVTSTIFNVFGMTRPRIDTWFLRSLANTQATKNKKNRRVELTEVEQSLAKVKIQKALRHWDAL